MNNAFPTARELANEAREALRRHPRKPGELFDRLVRLGLINKQGEITTLLGGDAQPEGCSPNGAGTTVPAPMPAESQ
jgi:hypothetical protein